MNAKRVNAAATVLLAAQQRGRFIPAALAMALESANLLQSPEKDTSATAEAEFTPTATALLTGLALTLREQPTARQLLDGLDELGELVVCDGDPTEIADWVAALCRLADIDVHGAGPAIAYRVEHDSIVAGLYTTAAAAQQHCEALVSREYPASVAVLFEWCVDEEDTELPGLELDVQVDGRHVSTGYTVTPLEIATAYDPDADE
ncbi:hypothetical protein [Streptomyces sp. NPDC058620]|uniref:hypothetical protein n=1 Tax=Streptomyces sp. NPDC058620 TaxID=3346560 RepID=UPI0036670E44